MCGHCTTPSIPVCILLFFSVVLLPLCRLPNSHGSRGFAPARLADRGSLGDGRDEHWHGSYVSPRRRARARRGHERHRSRLPLGRRALRQRQATECFAPMEPACRSCVRTTLLSFCGRAKSFLSWPQSFGMRTRSLEAASNRAIARASSLVETAGRQPGRPSQQSSRRQALGGRSSVSVRPAGAWASSWEVALICLVGPRRSTNER